MPDFRHDDRRGLNRATGRENMLRVFGRIFGGLCLVFVTTVLASGGAAVQPDELAASQSRLLIDTAGR